MGAGHAQIVEQHPLKSERILEVALAGWDKLWQTTIGSGATAVRLAQLDAPATVVGYFFEVLLGRELAACFPGEWRGGSREKQEKDLVCESAQQFSIEMKTSGQLGWKIFGNRSYGQKALDPSLVKKEKSGYYLTVNVVKQTLTRIRFGWIDADDWKPQLAPTGQMAGLPDSVYRYKLIRIRGRYELQAPVRLLEGIGEVMAKQLGALGIRTIADLLQHSGTLPQRFPKTLLERVRQEYGPPLAQS